MNFDIEKLSEDTAVALLERECFYRKTEAFQRLYDKFEYYKGTFNEAVEDMIQLLVLEEFGFLPTDENLKEYRLITSKFSESERVINSAFYLKYNIMKDEPLIKEGSPVCNVSLLNLEGNKTDLFSQMSADKPTVILAGSIS